MKPLALHLLFANIFLSLWMFPAKAFHPEGGDTVVVRLKNRNKVVIITDRDRDLKSFRTIDINRIVADIDSSFQSDSSSRNGMDADARISRRDSVMVIRKRTGGNQISVYKAVIDVEDEDFSFRDTVRIYRHRDGRYVGPRMNLGNNKNDDVFEIDLGFNNYLEDGAIPSDGGSVYGLRPFNSNVVSLRYNKTLLGRKESNLFSLTAGLEFSWNNYKFENPVIIRRGSSGVAFDPFPADQKMIKSKLTVSWLNVPVMFHYRAPKSSFHLALGGYAGYRLGSHSKTKFSEDGNTKKEKERANFYLNSFQYGVRLQFGFYDVDFFATYNFNELFANNKGPALTPISFGITL
jgi:hypothetical protein